MALTYKCATPSASTLAAATDEETNAPDNPIFWGRPRATHVTDAICTPCPGRTRPKNQQLLRSVSRGWFERRVASASILRRVTFRGFSAATRTNTNTDTHTHTRAIHEQKTTIIRRSRAYVRACVLHSKAVASGFIWLTFKCN